MMFCLLFTLRRKQAHFGGDHDNLDWQNGMTIFALLLPGGSKPTLEVTMDVSAVPADGSSSQDFKEAVFGAIRNSLLGLDTDGAPFLLRAIRTGEVQVCGEGG